MPKQRNKRLSRGRHLDPLSPLVAIKCDQSLRDYKLIRRAQLRLVYLLQVILPVEGKRLLPRRSQHLVQYRNWNQDQR